MLNGIDYVLETAIDRDFFGAYPDFVQLLSIVPPKLLDQEVLISDILARNQKGDYVNMPNVRNFTLNANMLSQSLRAGRNLPRMLQRYQVIYSYNVLYALNYFNEYLAEKLFGVEEEDPRRISRIVQTTAALDMIDTYHAATNKRGAARGISAQAIAVLSQRRGRSFGGIVKSMIRRSNAIEPNLNRLQDGRSAIGVIERAACAYGNRITGMGDEEYYFLRQEAISGGLVVCAGCALRGEMCARAARLNVQKQTPELPNIRANMNNFALRMALEYY